MENETAIEVQPLYLDRINDNLAETHSKIFGHPARQIDTEHPLYIPFRNGYFVINQFVFADSSGERFFTAAKGWQGNDGTIILPYLNFERAAGHELQAKLDSENFLPRLPPEVRIREAVKQITASCGLFLREGYILRDGAY